MVTDLLATCTVGENTATESICWTVFTVEELLEILNRPESEIPLYRKRSFVRFLVWVYMNAGGSVMQKGASYLSHSKYVPNFDGGHIFYLMFAAGIVLVKEECVCPINKIRKFVFCTSVCNFMYLIDFFDCSQGNVDLLKSGGSLLKRTETFISLTAP